jgi:hypothetical protein
MTKAKVELCYDGKPSRVLFVDLKGNPKGQKLMNAIEGAVEKAAKDDKEWTRWNLLDVLSVGGR